VRFGMWAEAVTTLFCRLEANDVALSLWDFCFGNSKMTGRMPVLPMGSAFEGRTGILPVI
jgi:hypothetical protein